MVILVVEMGREGSLLAWKRFRSRGAAAQGMRVG